MPFSWMKPGVITVAAAAACVLGVAAPAGAAARTARTAASLMPMSTSWTTPSRGVVLGYPSRKAGGRASLFLTGNGGRSWRKLPTPPIPFPVDNDTPLVTWSDGVIAITDGTRIVVSRDGGTRYSRVSLAGIHSTAHLFVGSVTVADGRLIAIVTRTNTSKGTATEAVYSGPASGDTLRAVSGLSVSGGSTYGDIVTTGGLQVILGNEFKTERYWVSRNGTRFTTVPTPCPVADTVLLGGTVNGRPTALCSTSASSVTFGQNQDQVRTAPRTGGKFTAASPLFVYWNAQDFAAASRSDMTIASAAGLNVTVNAGRTWRSELTQPNGAFWMNLAFPSSSTGVAVANTVDKAGNLVGIVYRTTNAGRAWHELSLP